ncbi:L-histidine N(alpha)-methyltransferase [Sphingomonas sp.]|uniref:L-histidine N(alpha)-methyltransferase n=1 Tax=Sphingomonas sp. TaxID=28214 RepID=UPI002FCB592E
MPQLIDVLVGDFEQAVLTGLAQPQKVIPARFFYDRRGSELFEQITQLPEYYPTRTETALLRAHGEDIARYTGTGRTVVEFGSGSSAKTPLLLSAVRANTYVPIDISGPFLADAAAGLAKAYPNLKVLPIAGDFTQPLRLPDAIAADALLGFFPGSTIGNFAPRQAIDLLRSFAATLGEDARLVIGIDLRKNPRLIETAYDDAGGVTAAFNLNLLHRINNELDGDVPIELFEHRAVWQDALGRIEMHLAASRDLSFEVAGRRFAMKAGETIHTENSYKYRPEEARLLARASGWEPMAAWCDADALFSLHVWQAQGRKLEP